MLNPSTADDKIDDRTIKRCIDFAKRWRYGSLIVVNLFAYRSTDSDKLKGVSEPIGKENDFHISDCIAKADIVICAWGQKGKLLNRNRQVINRLKEKNIKLYYLKKTKNGEPWHPLFVSKTSLPRLYD